MRDDTGRQSNGVRLTVSAWGEPGGLSPGEVRVWVVPLASPPLGRGDLLALLTADERARAERFRVEKARHQFVTGRGLLRSLLAERLGVAAADVPIAYTGAGKPVLADPSAGLHFNVTHTDGLALIALSDRPVGVDTEEVRPLANPDGLVERFFSRLEREAYRSLAADLRPAGFFRGWTCKEAVVKAAGLGVSYLDDFDVELHPDRPAAVLGARHPGLVDARLRLAAWEPMEGYVAAVAVGG